MKILFLDDEERRHRVFRFANKAGHSIVHVYNYEETIEALQFSSVFSEPFDVAYLDHDLIEQTSRVEKTGYDVVKYIVAMPPEKRPRKFVIHSWNLIGRESMAALLRENGCEDVSIEPFGETPP